MTSTPAVGHRPENLPLAVGLTTAAFFWVVIVGIHGVTSTPGPWHGSIAGSLDRLLVSDGMPLVRIDVLQGYSAAERRSIGDCVQRAMVETLGVPERDRFQVISEHEPQNFDFNRSYLEIERTDRFVAISITLSAGRTADAKQAFYARLAELLGEGIGLRAEDLAVILTENERHDWSFGRGEASYVVIPKDQWR